jgi:hypothetical protein
VGHTSITASVQTDGIPKTTFFIFREAQIYKPFRIFGSVFFVMVILYFIYYLHEKAKAVKSRLDSGEALGYRQLLLWVTCNLHYFTDHGTWCQGKVAPVLN